MRKESTARIPDVAVEYKERKVIRLITMTCPSEENVLKKNNREL